MQLKPHSLLILWMLLINVASAASASGETSTAPKSASFSGLGDPMLNPWLGPLDQCASQPGKYHLDINMGFLNTDYFCRIDPKLGAQFNTNTIQPINRDAARLILSKIIACRSMASERILIGASRNTTKQIEDLLSNRPQDSIIQIGKRKQHWRPPETHAKVFQLDNGVDQFFTVHGSLNLQTVGLSCKANNALRFTESEPVLYHYFKKLGDAVQANDGRAGFGTSGEINSSGTQLAPVNLADYTIHFYGGKGMGFVGSGSAPQNTAWPAYINPPINKQHAPGIVNWYDSIIYDAAKQLRQGRSVKIDVLIFEIGEESAFVNNLWRFTKTGFEQGKTEDKTAEDMVQDPFIGKLDVRFLWQFQSGNNRNTVTYANLNGVARAANSQGNYKIETGRIWPIFNPSGIAMNPKTPRDMHNKLAVLNVIGHEEERKIYITSSNMDTPNVGSGKLWQAGTIVQGRSDVNPWGASNINTPNLWNAYKQYFDLLWNNREGQAHSGQIQFSKQLDERRSDGFVNWIETLPPRNGHQQMKSKDGIDAFFFPIPISKAPTPQGDR